MLLHTLTTTLTCHNRLTEFHETNFFTRAAAHLRERSPRHSQLRANRATARTGKKGIQMMDKDLFDELLASVSKAGEILRGEREPSRTVTLKATSADTSDFPNPRAIREQFKLTRPQLDRKSVVKGKKTVH